MRTPRPLLPLIGLTALFLTVLGGLVSAPPAAAQFQCDAGVLVDDQCRIEGVPVQTGATCPNESDVDQATCERFFQAPAEGCPAGWYFQIATGQCRTDAFLLAPTVSCEAGFALENNRCYQYVPATCGALGCNGTIRLTYTVECVSPGVSRVVLGPVITENGAAVSFITLNGSAQVDAPLQNGQAVNLSVTAEDLRDDVVVSGPTAAPDCGQQVQPTPTPTPLSNNPNPTPVPPTAVPSQSNSAPPPAGTSGPTATPEPTATPTPTPTPDGTPTPTPLPAIEPTATPVTFVLDPTVVPPTALPLTPAPLTPVAVTVDVPVGATVPEASGDSQLIPLALIGGATVVLAAGAYGATSNRNRANGQGGSGGTNGNGGGRGNTGGGPRGGGTGGGGPRRPDGPADQGGPASSATPRASSAPDAHGRPSEPAPARKPEDVDGREERPSDGQPRGAFGSRSAPTPPRRSVPEAPGPGGPVEPIDPNLTRGPERPRVSGPGIGPAQPGEPVDPRRPYGPDRPGGRVRPIPADDPPPHQ